MKKRIVVYCCLCGATIIDPTSDEDTGYNEAWESSMCPSHDEKEIDDYINEKTIPYCSICGKQGCEHMPNSLSRLHVDVPTKLRDKFKGVVNSMGSNITDTIINLMKLYQNVKEDKTDEFVKDLKKLIHQYENPEGVCSVCEKYRKIYQYSKSNNPVCEECYNSQNPKRTE